MAHEEMAGSFQAYAGDRNIIERGTAVTRRSGRLDAVAAQQMAVVKYANELTHRLAQLCNRLGVSQNPENGPTRAGVSGDTKESDCAVIHLERGVGLIHEQLGRLTQQIARLEEL